MYNWITLLDISIDILDDNFLAEMKKVQDVIKEVLNTSKYSSHNISVSNDTYEDSIDISVSVAEYPTTEAIQEEKDIMRKWAIKEIERLQKDYGV